MIQYTDLDDGSNWCIRNNTLCIQNNTLIQNMQNKLKITIFDNLKQYIFNESMLLKKVKVKNLKINSIKL